jgi:hypothetical protein
MQRLRKPQKVNKSFISRLREGVLCGSGGAMYIFGVVYGLSIAVIMIGFWCVKFYKVLNEGTLQPAVNEMIFPILLVVLLANGRSNMRDLTLGARNAMDSVNRSVNVVINSEVSFRTAAQILAGSDLIASKAGNLLDQCKDIVENSEFELCMRVQGEAARLMAQGITGGWSSNAGSRWQAQVQGWQDFGNRMGQSPFKYKTPEELKAATSKDPKDVVENKAINDVISYNDTAYLRGLILSCRTAFLYIVEIMMIVTGLVGPIFLALSMFPLGTKPLIAWGTSFLSLGFCKICFSLVSGLSSVAMVYVKPENSDMLTLSIILGLLAPVISFSIASGAGIGALNTLSYAGQGFGLSTGIAPVPMGTGPGGSGVPPTALASTQQQDNNKSSQRKKGF